MKIKFIQDNLHYILWSCKYNRFFLVLLMTFCVSQGEVVALDRIRNKIDRIRQNAQMLHLRCIKAYCFNSTQAVSSDPAQEAEGTEWQHHTGSSLWIFIREYTQDIVDRCHCLYSRTSLPPWEFWPGSAGRSLQRPRPETQHGEHLEPKGDLFVPAAAAQIIPCCMFYHTKIQHVIVSFCYHQSGSVSFWSVGGSMGLLLHRSVL